MPELPIYLDHHATTPTDPRVVEEMLPYFSRMYGNAGSQHAFGYRTAKGVERGRERVAKLLNCTSEEVVFTSGATEANNLALKGFSAACSGPVQIISTVAEHRGVLDPLKRLQREGVGITLLPVDREGRVSAEEIRRAIRPESKLVSVMLANNEIGSINPLKEICDVCHERGVVVHTDGTQGVGKIRVDLGELDVDLLSLSGHKLYGPQGIGALIVRERERPIRLKPLIEGGGQERRLRRGTLPVALIVGLGKACELAGSEMEAEGERVREWREEMWRRLEAGLPGTQRNTPSEEVLPMNLNVTFAGIDGEQLLRRLTEVAVSSGAACSSAEPRPSYVLQAIGLSEEEAKRSIRIGLGRFNTREEIEYAAEYLIRIVRDMQ